MSLPSGILAAKLSDSNAVRRSLKPKKFALTDKLNRFPRLAGWLAGGK
jgi:hypothetical protein